MDKMLHGLAGSVLKVAVIVGLIAWPLQDSRARQWLALAGGLTVIAMGLLLWT